MSNYSWDIASSRGWVSSRSWAQRRWRGKAWWRTLSEVVMRRGGGSGSLVVLMVDRQSPSQRRAVFLRRKAPGVCLSDIVHASGSPRRKHHDEGWCVAEILEEDSLNGHYDRKPPTLTGIPEVELSRLYALVPFHRNVQKYV